jgi:integrase
MRIRRWPDGHRSSTELGTTSGDPASAYSTAVLLPDGRPGYAVGKDLSSLPEPSDASHIRRSFRRVVEVAGLNPGEWTPRELRHSFVSLLSDAGVPIEHISRLVGHSGTTTTETIYRKQIRPVLVRGADAMDLIFPTENHDA